MKRLFLLPVLMFGLSFACDQPYEEVAGIKIGCSVDEIPNAEKFIEAGNFDGGVGLLNMDADGIFDNQIVIHLNNTVEGVALLQAFNKISKEEFYVLIDTLEQRWGASETQELRGDLQVAFLNQENDIMGIIIAEFDSSSRKASIQYISKKLRAAKKEQEAKEKEALQKKFEGL